jgi:ribosomal protein S12 methylthiotransferase
MESEEAICPYIDLPLQHIDNRILRAMRRGGTKGDLWALIESIRRRKRHISLRTTFMVGFPGETEAVFRELCEFVRQAEFEHLGAFLFSPEAGTRAARLKEKVDRQVAQRRLDEIMTLQAGISKTLNQKLVGRTLPVLIEGPSQESDLLLNGRTAAMAPEVDGRVLINEGEAAVGEILPVAIREAYSYDLVGKVQETGALF